MESLFDKMGGTYIKCGDYYVPNLGQFDDETEIAEQELLLARKRGHALFMVGAKRLHITFEIPEYKMKYMGRAGGR